MANIKNYKLLDITELSASTWSTAEKVLGLDENDKVVMAQPEENVNPEYVDAEIQEAIGAETARTEEVYAKKSELPDMEDYALASSVTQDIQTAIASETARTEDTYAKKSEIPDMDDYYTKAEVDQAIADVDVSDQLVEYAKTTAVTEAIQTAMAAETARTESTYLKEHQSLDNYYTKAQTDSEITAATQDMATETWVGQQGYLTEHQSLAGLFDDARYVSSSKTINFYDKTDTLVATIDATDFIKDGMVDNVYISNGVLVISFNTDAGQEDIEIPLTDIFDPANYYDKTAIDGMFAAETARTESTYLKEHQSLDNYYTKAQVDAEITGATEGMATETWVQNQGYLTEHQDLSAYAKTTAVTQDIQTAIAAETGRTESTYAKKSDIPSIDGYWTSAQTQSAITAATEDMATETWVGEQGYLTEHQDISGKLDVSVFTGYTGATETVLGGKADISDIPDVSGFVTSGDVETQIGTAMAAETARTESTYLKEHQDISGKLDKTDFNTYTGATETALDGKVDLATYTAYTGTTATEIAGKQETLVSGTNIKTINNQSLLGSGNIDIQGGGGGGNVVELTQAQYDALDPPAADTTYIITDADVVDLNDYAPSSGLTELSGTVATINSNYATKQNVTARASNSNYLPGWNAQGVITGSTAYYSKSQGINGTNYNVFSNSNTNHPAIFAPTSAGTAGQPLLSNGSGAPVWGGYKFAFITQTQYDALVTKDATTIYFITGD